MRPIVFLCFLGVVLAAPHKQDQRGELHTSQHHKSSSHRQISTQHQQAPKVQLQQPQNPQQHPKRGQQQPKHPKEQFTVNDVHMIVTPLRCPAGERETAAGCRPEFRRKREVVGGPIDMKPAPKEYSKENPLHAVPQCIIGCQLPGLCPPGQKEDENGNCKDDWGDY